MAEQRLLFNGASLSGAQTIGACEIEDGTTVYLAPAAASAVLQGSSQSADTSADGAQPAKAEGASMEKILNQSFLLRSADEIELGRSLGKGSFAAVQLAMSRGQELAAKVFNPASDEEEAMLRKIMLVEVRALAKLPHKNIVRLMGVCIDRSKMCILMENMEQGSLRKVLDEFPNQSLPLWLVFRILREVASAMAFVHSVKPHPIVHRVSWLVDAEWINRRSAGRQKNFGFGEL